MTATDLNDMLAGADLTDATTRAVMADALAEAGRDEEADFLRTDWPVEGGFRDGIVPRRIWFDRGRRAMIRRLVRERLGNRRAVIEVGLRLSVIPWPEEWHTSNMLLWREDADLSDVEPLDSVKWVEWEPTGAVLDCYCYVAEREGGGLIGNVYVTIDHTGTVRVE